MIEMTTLIKKGKSIGFGLILFISAFGCKAVDQQPTVYIEDRDMDFGAHHEQFLEENVFSYREAAAGGTKGKTGGGCGCN